MVVCDYGLRITDYMYVVQLFNPLEDEVLIHPAPHQISGSSRGAECCSAAGLILVVHSRVRSVLLFIIADRFYWTGRTRAALGALQYCSYSFISDGCLRN